jgi:hypothetical protein
MRILAITTRLSGVGYHRIMMPVANMQKDYALVTDTLTEEVLEQGFDILIINRVLPGVLPEKLLEWKNKYKFKLVVDNDDYWDLDVYHQLYERYIKLNVPEQIKGFIRIADVCTVTHDRLAEEVYPYNNNVEVLPNALPYGEEQFLGKKIEADKVRLFWSGSGTHERDIKILKEPLKRIIGMPVQMVIAGYNDLEGKIWDLMTHYFSAGMKLDIKIYRYNDILRYMEAYGDSDISLIPLQDTKFNAMKSNLKVLETAAKKNPAIVSNVHPYKGLPVHYVNSQKDWYKHIRELTNDKQAREESGLKLFEYCNKHFNFKEINSNRYRIYSKLLDARKEVQ